MAGTSASSTLRHNSPVTARFTKLGPRIFTRYGIAPPWL